MGIFAFAVAFWKVRSQRRVIFSSLQYLLFLPIVTFLYWRTSGTTRLWLLLAASYFFYMSWMPVYGFLLLAMSLGNWAFGLAIEKTRKEANPIAKMLLVLALFLNLACLCYYKYSSFLLTNLLNLFSVVGQNLHISSLEHLSSPALNIILPLGISFFVFEFIHYLVDVYRGNQALNSWLKFAIFASFFPSQIAGPIKRYQDFVEKLEAPAPLSKALFYEAMTLIMQGLFKKVAIADPLGNIIAPAYASSHALGALDAGIAAFGFSIQIFCDFSGYTDIGRGSALLLGIRLPRNFDLPYIAQDIGQFWRRWHMSLSFWIRDYVYIPLGGSRSSYWRNQWNLFLTMSICGLWHGAAWQFIAWGSVHGLALIVNRQWREVLSRFGALEKGLDNIFIKACNMLMTFLFVVMAFVMFRAASLTQAMNVWQNLLNCGIKESMCLEPMLKSGVLVFALVYVGFWICCDVMKKLKPPEPVRLLFASPSLRAGAWTAAILLMLAAKPVVATPFIYFQF